MKGEEGRWAELNAEALILPSDAHEHPHRAHDCCDQGGGLKVRLVLDTYWLSEVCFIIFYPPFNSSIILNAHLTATVYGLGAPANDHRSITDIHDRLRGPKEAQREREREKRPENKKENESTGWRNTYRLSQPAWRSQSPPHAKLRRVPAPGQAEECGIWGGKRFVWWTVNSLHA